MEQKLLDLKEKINSAKTQILGLNGQKAVLMKQLKEEFSCSTIKEAETKLQSLRDEGAKLEIKINKELKKLEETYNFEFE